MNVCVLGEISRTGGGQQYVGFLLRALKEEEITLVTGTNRDPLGLLALVDNTINVNYEYIEGTGYFKDFIKVKKLKKELQSIRGNYDITINNHPNVFIRKCDINIMHGFSFLNDFIDQNGALTKMMPYHIIKILHVYSEYGGGKFVFNSEYTRKISAPLFKKLGIEYMDLGVLYPSFEWKKQPSPHKDGILMFGRINRDKKIHLVLEQLRAVDLGVTVSGAVNKGDEPYFNFLKKNFGDKVRFIPNPSESVKEELMASSLIYIHSNVKENFGITVLESMAAGCIPIVPKSGAPWIDILEEGKFGLGYDQFDKIPEVIDQARHIYNQSEIAKSVSRFSFSQFKDRLSSIISTVQSL